MFHTVVRSMAPLVMRRPVVALRAPVMREFATEEIVKPDLVETLEWTLTSPPPLHQFDEPPIIVEIAHLDAVQTPDH